MQWETVRNTDTGRAWVTNRHTQHVPIPIPITREKCVRNGPPVRCLLFYFIFFLSSATRLVPCQACWLAQCRAVARTRLLVSRRACNASSAVWWFSLTPDSSFGGIAAGACKQPRHRFAPPAGLSDLMTHLGSPTTMHIGGSGATSTHHSTQHAYRETIRSPVLGANICGTSSCRNPNTLAQQDSGARCHPACSNLAPLHYLPFLHGHFSMYGRTAKNELRIRLILAHVVLPPCR